MGQRTALVAAALTAALSLPGAVAAEPSGDRPAGGPTAAAGAASVPGEVIVRYRAGTDPFERSAARRAVDAELEEKLPLPATELVTVDGNRSPAAVAGRLERLEDVLYAEPNFVRRAAAVPNDPRFGSLWGMHNTGQTVAGIAGAADADIDAPEAWDLGTGSPSDTVAVVDSGVALDHPDLAPNAYDNPGETGAGRELNGIDDDQNGFVDDARGWDFVGDDADARDFNGHGTHVAGTLGARGSDGAGIAGVNFNARILPLRVLDASGSGTTSDVIAAYRYAARSGARIVNASLGGGGSSQAERDAIASAPNTLFVVAAGNGGEDGVGDDNDSTPEYPCAYDLPNVICVAATDSRDALTGFSNYGATSVDLAAPGRTTLSAQPAYETLRQHNFDTTGAAGWTSGGTGATWGASTAAASSGTTSLADSPSGGYANLSDSYARTSLPVSLAGRAGCAVAYRLRLDLAAGDRLLVEASTDNTVWSTVATETDPTGGRFISTGADLSQLDGRTAVYLRFRLVSDASGTADGAYVDDFKVTCLGVTYDGSEFAYYSGTSMATPHVAGAAALVLGRRPGATAAEIRAALLGGVDPLPGLAGKTVTGGRLNAFAALGGTPQPPPADPPASDPPSDPGTGTGELIEDLADTIRPGLAVSVPRQRIASVRRRGLVIRARCSEACGLRASLLMSRATARRLRVPVTGSAVRIASANGRLAAPGIRNLRAYLTARAGSRLRRVRRVELVLRTRAIDNAGNASVVNRRLVLRP